MSCFVVQTVSECVIVVACFKITRSLPAAVQPESHRPREQRAEQELLQQPRHERVRCGGAGQDQDGEIWCPASVLMTRKKHTYNIHMYKVFTLNRKNSFAIVDCANTEACALPSRCASTSCPSTTDRTGPTAAWRPCCPPFKAALTSRIHRKIQKYNGQQLLVVRNCCY